MGRRGHVIGAEQHNGELLHAQFAGGHPDPGQIHTLLAQIDDLHRRVVPVEEEFGATIGMASRQIGQLLLVVLPLGCALLLLAGVSRSRAQLRRDARMAAPCVTWPPPCATRPRTTR